MSERGENLNYVITLKKKTEKRVSVKMIAMLSVAQPCVNDEGRGTPAWRLPWNQCPLLYVIFINFTSIRALTNEILLLPWGLLIDNSNISEWMPSLLVEFESFVLSFQRASLLWVERIKFYRGAHNDDFSPSKLGKAIGRVGFRFRLPWTRSECTFLSPKLALWRVCG